MLEIWKSSDHFCTLASVCQKQPSHKNITREVNLMYLRRLTGWPSERERVTMDSLDTLLLVLYLPRPRSIKPLVFVPPRIQFLLQFFLPYSSFPSSHSTISYASSYNILFSALRPNVRNPLDLSRCCLALKPLLFKYHMLFLHTDLLLSRRFLRDSSFKFSFPFCLMNVVQQIFPLLNSQLFLV